MEELEVHGGEEEGYQEEQEQQDQQEQSNGLEETEEQRQERDEEEEREHKVGVSWPYGVRLTVVYREHAFPRPLPMAPGDVKLLEWDRFSTSLMTFQQM